MCEGLERTMGTVQGAGPATTVYYNDLGAKSLVLRRAAHEDAEIVPT